MALTRVGSKGIAPGAVDTNDLSDNTITSAKILGTISIEKGGTGLSNVGPSGNVLTSDGTSWVSKELVVPPSSNGDVTVRVFDTVGNVTWDKPADLIRVKVTVVGGGGGGGRGSQPAGAGGGGAGGGAAIKTIPAPSIPGPVLVTVGRGGYGKSTPGPGYGTPGNTSSFGSFCSATGGTGTRYGPSGAGGIGSDGDINIRGGASDPAGPNDLGSSKGGSSFLGQSGAYSLGAGGNGASAYTGNGIVIVEEFF